MLVKLKCGSDLGARKVMCVRLPVSAVGLASPSALNGGVTDGQKLFDEIENFEVIVGDY
ncbi:hypothetical protein AWA1501_24540 [Lactiplantibacillus pentosus]|uniref:hypothetical protein n=1 Tax=Lactiplantibacillus pentosus TaxID=1589 RepID=UPI001B2CE8B7|nr:hypothetical protein [Lactiplantibacillus pentosus]GIP70291.1 hypothetical protein AWA1501_24540 [Lactiplantibacillus pentosus]